MNIESTVDTAAQNIKIAYAEKLRPDETPEIAFQAYEKFEGSRTDRNEQKSLFFAGEVRNPALDYPYLDEDSLHAGIAVLDRIMHESQEVYADDQDVAEAVYNTIAYRMAEMYMLLEAKRMNDFASDPSFDDFRLSAERYQRANEELYGVPDVALADKVLGEIIGQARSKDLHPATQKLLDEVINGFDTEVAGETIHVDGMGEPSGERLPSDVSERVAVLAEILEEDTADVKQSIQQYWDTVIVPRDGADEFTVTDMAAVFTATHELRDPTNASRINIIIKDGATQLSWDTPSMSIQVGSERASIKSVDEMYAKVKHEYVKHAGGAVHGLATELPILGTGVYSDFDEGESADYLTFEEGIAVLCELAGDEGFQKWEPLHVSRYLAAVTAYKGMDFRQSFEMNWRARVLMVAKSGEEPTPAMIEKEQKQAYLSVLRLNRGTPTALSGGPVLTFNKDLAYLTGKMKALDFLEAAGEDKDLIRLALKTKIDPTNHRQLELAKKYGATV